MDHRPKTISRFHFCTKLGIIIALLTLALTPTVRAQGEGSPPPNNGQSNVQSTQSSPQTNIAPSPDIPSPDTFIPKGEGEDPHREVMMDLLAHKDYASFQDEFEKRPEAGWAEALGWVYYRDGQFNLAKIWFNRALSLDSTSVSSSYGLALIAKKQNNLNVASRGPQNPKMKDLVLQVDSQEAGEYYKKKAYAKCLELLAKVEQIRPLTTDERSLRAWSHYSLNEYGESAREFEALYREKRDQGSADGLFFSLQHLGQPDRARMLAVLLGGPLVQRVRTEQARDYYDRGLFLASENEDPGLYPGLQNIASPSLDLGIAARQKSGEAGLSRLNEERLPIGGGSVVFNGVDELTVHASQEYLDSDSLPANAQVGGYPVVQRPYSTTPTTSVDLAVVEACFTHQGWFSPYVKIGTTPIGGAISVLPTGRVGFVQQVDSGNWGLSIYSESNTESILSYAGIRDPYGVHGAWGRVVESGLESSGYVDLGDNWGFSGDGSVGALIGDNVETNEKAAMNASVGKDFRLDGFKYFVVGPSFFGEQFQHNLSGFTYGQGGYFSPKYLAQATMDLNFLTEEGQQYIVRARFGIGAQTNEQDSNPLFPLDPDGRTNSSSTQSSYVFSSEVEGVVRISDHWQFGGALAYDQTATYDEAKEMFFFRYLFEPRPAVYSSDIMNWP